MKEPLLSLCNQQMVELIRGSKLFEFLTLVLFNDTGNLNDLLVKTGRRGAVVLGGKGIALLLGEGGGGGIVILGG